MLISATLQPDQQPARWDAHAAAYEQVFEPLTDAFAARALEMLGPLGELTLLDVAAGAGGAALLAARQGAHVTAVDASPAMAARIAVRAAQTGLAVTAAVGDGMALPLPDGAFDRALSCFGIVLFPDPARGMAELHRVLRPGGRTAIVTWTEPHRYELAARLRAATMAVCGTPSPGELPAQLRFIDPGLLSSLLSGAGFQSVRVETVEAALHAPSAGELAASLAFAPGMVAMLDALGRRRKAVLDAFTAQLQVDGHTGGVSLGAVAHAAVGVRP
ncbi:MAG: class I SAM-dependent methyltransferase [Janthinobacterium lividum]